MTAKSVLMRSQGLRLGTHFVSPSRPTCCLLFPRPFVIQLTSKILLQFRLQFKFAFIIWPSLYHSKTKAFLFACFSSGWATITDRLIVPKVGNSIKCLSQGHSDALPQRKSNQGLITSTALCKLGYAAAGNTLIPLNIEAEIL